MILPFVSFYPDSVSAQWIPSSRTCACLGGSPGHFRPQHIWLVFPLTHLETTVGWLMCKAPNQSEWSKCQYGSGSPRSSLHCPPVSTVTIIRTIHEKTTAGTVAFANATHFPVRAYLSAWPSFGRGQRLMFLILMIGVGENLTKTSPFCFFILYWKDSPSSEVSVWRINEECLSPWRYGLLVGLL